MRALFGKSYLFEIDLAQTDLREIDLRDIDSFQIDRVVTHTIYLI